MSQSTADLIAMLDAEPVTTGEGPYLLITMNAREGLRLERFATYDEPAAMIENYTGEGGMWIFEVGLELGAGREERRRYMGLAADIQSRISPARQALKDPA